MTETEQEALERRLQQRREIWREPGNRIRPVGPWFDTYRVREDCTMSLHRKDFDAVAEAAASTLNMLRDHAREARNDGNENAVAEHVAHAQGYAEAIRDFANEVAVRHNPRFDIARFYRACALDENGFFVLEQDDD